MTTDVAPAHFKTSHMQMPEAKVYSAEEDSFSPHIPNWYLESFEDR